MAPPADNRIEIRGARTHNLKNVDCDIRREKLTVVTGVSGSGKSSLAFDTLYAEGQRRYVESLSTYARQFLEKVRRPDIDALRNVPPAIALEQKNAVTNARSTIGTATEINDYLRLLFARAGRVFCPDCRREVSADSAEGTAAALGRLPQGTRLLILAPVAIRSLDSLPATLAEMRGQGFARAMREDGSLIDLEEFGPEDLARSEAPEPVPARESASSTGGRGSGELERYLAAGGHSVGRVSAPLADEEEEESEAGGDDPEEPSGDDEEEVDAFVLESRFAGRIDLVADRVAVDPANSSRLAEALELAFRAGAGRVRTRDADTGAEWHFSDGLTCNGCMRSFRRPEPALFSFASPLGACPACQGFGRVVGIDMDKVIPNREQTLKEKPVVPWNTPANRKMYSYLKKSAPEIPFDLPLSRFTPEQWRVFVEGKGDWCGVDGFFRWFEGRRYKVQARVMLARYRAYTPCPDCGGTRLVPEALHTRVDGRNIAEMCRESVEDLHSYFDGLQLPPSQAAAAARLLEEIRSRLHYLESVGLGYLTLDRQTRTLSGGESQRINLATALGGALTETLYVLDEPTVGLHSRDTLRLLSILKALRERGNTVVVVEHDADIILGADDIIDVGPASGDQGGQILYAGTLEGLGRAERSLTARHMALPPRRPLPSRGRAPGGWVSIRGARQNNLKDIDARIPRGVFCCVTGVSGSGKSTLIHSVLYAGFHRARGRSTLDVGDFDRLEGAAGLADILLVDQKPIGRSARSNPVTYVKAYDPVRALFAATREAKRAGIKPGFFSFNIDGGRCEECEGAGVVTIDMHFLADVEVTCDKCDGKRFKREVLAIEWRGKNIDDVLAMTVNEAQGFFAFEPKILKALAPLEEVGLGYIRLGQSTATLSGGEAQRLKLAAFLAGAANFDNTMMIFDEPTTGLHPADVDRLAELFHRLVDRGVSLVVIEHNLDLIGHADWIIDMGPEGGDEGGRIVAEGPPRRVLAAPESYTGRFLKERFS